MTVIAEATVLIRPITQDFAKQLDTKVQQAVTTTNKKAVITPKIDDKGGSAKFGGALSKLDQKLQSVGKSGGVTSEVLSKLGVTGHKVSSLLSTGLAIGTAAAAAAITAFAVKGVHDFVALGNEVHNFQVISGATAEDSSRLVAATDALHVSSQAAGTGIFFLEKNLTKIEPKLAALGVTVERTASGNVDASKTFLNVADAISRTEDPATRAQIAFTAFGRGGKALLPILEQGRQGIQNLFDEAAKHGQILDQSQVDTAFKFQVALHELGQAASKFGRDLGSTLVPLLGSLVSGLDNVLTKAEQVAGFLDRNFFGPLGHDLEVAKKAADSWAESTAKLFHIPQDLGPVKGLSQEIANQAAAAGLDADQINKLLTANGLIPTAADEATVATLKAAAASTDAASASAALAEAQANAAAAEKHHINQLNALGPSITHAFGDTKHQVLEWQQTLIQSLNFVSTNLGSIASQLDQNAKDGSKAIQDATKASTSAQDRVQLAQDRLSIFQAKLHAQSTVSAADNAREKLLQDQLSQAKDRAGTASEKLASAQRKDANASKEVLAAFDSQLHQMVVYRQNFDILLARHAPADLIKQLTDLGQSGSSVVAALAGANATQFEKILRDWRHARDQAPGVGHDIRKGFLKEGPIKIPIAFDLAQVRKEKGGAARSELIQALGTVKVPVSAALQVSTPSVTVEGTNVKVSVPPRMFGGPVSAGDPFLVGERGPELFVPNSSGSIVPNDRLRGGFSSQEVDRIIQAIEKAIQLSRPIQVTEVAQSPVATAEAVAARLGLAGVR